MGELKVVKKKVTALTVVNKKNSINQGEIFVPEVFKCKPLKSLSLHEDEVFFVKIIPASQNISGQSPLLLSASHDRTIKITELFSGKIIKLVGHQGGVWSLSVFADKIISCSTDKTIRIWNLYSGKMLAVLTGHQNQIYAVTNHEKMIISAALDKTIRFWDLDTGKYMGMIETPESSIWSLLPIGNFLIGGSSDGTLKIWNLPTKELLHSEKIHQDSITAIKVSKNRLITASRDKTIKIHQLADFSLLKVLIGHRSGVWTIEVDQNLIISGSEDRTLKIWQSETGELLETLSGHQEWVSSVTADERFVISGSGDHTVRIWEKVPLHDWRTIELTIPEVKKDPFETESDFSEKKHQVQQKFYQKLLDYDYIKVGSAELIAEDYSKEKEILPLEVELNCKKVADFCQIKNKFATVIKIPLEQAESFYKTGSNQPLYLKFFLRNEQLDFLLCLNFFGKRILLENKLMFTNRENKKGEIKTGRIEILHLPPVKNAELIRQKPENDCNSINTADTFRLPFEDQNKFRLRLTKKLLTYGYINIGKAELLANEFNPETGDFPLKVSVSCEKILNISNLTASFPAKIVINRQIAREMFKESPLFPLYISYLENEGKIFYQLSLHFRDESYFLFTKDPSLPISADSPLQVDK